MSDRIREYPEVKFWPWVGENYGTPKGSLLAGTGRRLLVLGESHYGTPKDDYPEFTRKVVKEFLEVAPQDFSGRTGETFFRIAEALTGQARQYAQDTTFQDVWKDIAFYNYIQELIGETTATRPTSLMWREAFQPFLSVLKVLQPTDVWVCGIQLWQKLPSNPTGAQFIPDGDNRMDSSGWPTGSYIVDGHQASLFPTYHPSPRTRFNWEMVHADLKKIFARNG